MTTTHPAADQQLPPVTMFILSALAGEGDIRDDLGVPDYSYRFVLEGFAPALERLGTVARAHDQAGVVALAAQAAARGQSATFLCFTPPHRVPLGLPCRTVCVFAWEFGTIPAEQLDEDPRSDWTHVFARVAGVISLSEHAARLVRAAMGPAVPAAAIFAPLSPRFFDFPSRVPGVPGVVRLHGMAVDTQPADAAEPARPLPWRQGGLGGRLARAVTRRLRPAEAILPAKDGIPRLKVELRGIVYTSVFNPMDGRKNWQDLMTAFCYAFREQPDATLVMKMVHRHTEAFTVLLAILTRALAPFACRIVALHGWMEDDVYDTLVAATDYYVNVSTGEGQCVPLMEFMAAGRPAVAPDHTAMAEYVSPANAFVLRSGEEYNVWPHDPRDLFRTTRRRLEWESLFDAFRASHRVATQEPDRYRAMGGAARRAIAACGSRDAAEARLRAFMAVLPA